MHEALTPVDLDAARRLRTAGLDDGGSDLASSELARLAELGLLIDRGFGWYEDTQQLVDVLASRRENTA